VGAKLALTVGEARDVVTLPLSAVDGSSESGIVYVVENGKTHPRDVKLGLHDGVNVEISSGLKTGALVLDPPPSVFEAGGK
jgi:multidrug efflux pump subunit AcrA (membrane-fusion protein)